MNLLLLLLLLSGFKKTYFEAIYSIEKQPFDKAVSDIYKQIKNSPDSLLCDITINHSAAKIASLEFQTFIDKLNEIEDGLPYIDSIFYIYTKHYTVYDTLLYNYLRLTLFTRTRTQVEKELEKLYRAFKNDPDLVNIILFYASRYNVQNMVTSILSENKYNLDSLSATTLLTLARTFYERAEYQKMGRIIKVLANKDLRGKERIEFLKLKGFSFEAMDNVDSALFYLTQYIESSTEPDLKVFHHLISLYIKKGYYDDAKKYVLLLLKQSPFNYKLRKQAGYAYFMLQKYDSSLINYLIARSLTKNDPEIHYYIARVLIRKNLYKDALRSIEKAEKIRRNYSYSLLKAFILFKLNYIDDAARELLIWKNKGQNDPYYLYLTGVVLKSLGRRKLSFKYLNLSIQKDPSHPARYIPLLSLAPHFADTQFVKMLVDTVRNLHLVNTDDIFDLAYAAQYLNDVYLADSLYRLLIAQNPSKGLYYNNLGYLWLTNGDIQKAEKYLKKAFELSPEDPYVLDSYAWLLFKKGEIEEAYKLSKKAHKMSNDKVIEEHFRIIKDAFKKNRR